MARRTLDGLRKAAWVTCDSSAMRDELLDHQLVSAARVIVAPLGVHPACRAEPDAEADQEARRLLDTPAGDTINLLHVGSTVPRKRIDLLLQVFAALRERFTSLRLVRVGGPFTPAQMQLAHELGVTQDIIVLPFLDRSMLAAVYRLADLVLQPSDMEGFGLPVVEAMACGTPVVASDLPVLREVGGQATAFCKPGDVTGWTNTITELLTERQHFQDSWRKRCLAAIGQAGAYSWTNYAQQMVTLYKNVTHQKLHSFEVKRVQPPATS